MPRFVATRIFNGRPTYRPVEFDLPDRGTLTDQRNAAWRKANDGIDPLSGEWVEVRLKRVPKNPRHNGLRK